MQDRPTADELLDSVAEYLFTELRPEVPREQRFKVLVAANVCAVVAREIRAGKEPDSADLALFGELLGEEVENTREAAAELSRRLRAGELDDRIDQLTPRLEEHVRRKLDVARPGYSGGD
jgi:ferritin-like protein